VKGRPAVWLNAGLGVVLLAASGGSYVYLTRTSGSTTGTGLRTATARTGAVTAAITGTGNVQSAASVGVSFGVSGTVTAVYVKVGQKVRAGDRLAAVDATAARRSLATAQAQLASAQASYDLTAAGQTASARQRDTNAVYSARVAFDRADRGVNAADSAEAADRRRLDAAVAAAERALRAGTGTQAQVDAAKAARTATLAKDSTAVTAAEQQRTQAANDLRLQQLVQQEDADGPTAAQLAQAKAQLQSATATEQQAAADVANAVLTAPQDGTVVSISGTVGDSVGSSGGSGSSGASSGSSGGPGGGSGSTGGTGSSTGTGSTGTSASSSSSSSSGFLTLADLDAVSVTADIAEADAAKVKVGQEATVTFPATQATGSGRVTEVSPLGTVSNNVVQYPITVTLDQAPADVRLGASASLSITTASVQDALVVPTSAITTLGDRHTATVLRNGVQTVVPVDVGVQGDTGTQVLSGLTAGEVVVLSTTSGTTTGGGFPRLGGGLGGLGGAGR
jgi:multidrug efflux pump subunit AcrA (membrane-fusion protein)